MFIVGLSKTFYLSSLKYVVAYAELQLQNSSGTIAKEKKTTCQVIIDKELTFLL